jgi:hypothetical protein
MSSLGSTPKYVPLPLSHLSSPIEPGGGGFAFPGSTRTATRKDVPGPGGNLTGGPTRTGTEVGCSRE